MDVKDQGKVVFSREQYEYLNKVFGEFLGSTTTTHQEFSYQAGQRRVVQYIKERVRS